MYYVRKIIYPVLQDSVAELAPRQTFIYAVCDLLEKIFVKLFESHNVCINLLQQFTVNIHTNTVFNEFFTPLQQISFNKI